MAESIKNGWMPDVLKLEMEDDKQYPELFAHKWLGEPVSQAEKAIINRQNVLKAMKREIEGDGQEIVGADIARMGMDRIVFWKRKGLKTTSHKVYSKLRTPETCDMLEQFVGFNKDIEIRVDNFMRMEDVWDFAQDVHITGNYDHPTKKNRKAIYFDD